MAWFLDVVVCLVSVSRPLADSLEQDSDFYRQEEGEYSQKEEECGLYGIHADA